MPSSKKSQRRAESETKATKIAANVQRALIDAGRGECTDRAIAKSWDLGSHHPVSDRFDPARGRCMSLGDALALPRELSRQILMACLAELESDGTNAAPLPEGEVLSRLVIEIGKAHEALLADLQDDGRINQHARHAAAFLQISALAMRGYLAATSQG
jgi:hypothetical protein